MEELMNSMDLEELLDASLIVTKNIREGKTYTVESPKSQELAQYILRLNEQEDTKPLVEEMIHNLNVQIIKVNEETADPVEGERAYRELMEEE